MNEQNDWQPLERRKALVGIARILIIKQLNERISIWMYTKSGTIRGDDSVHFSFYSSFMSSNVNFGQLQQLDIDRHTQRN